MSARDDLLYWANEGLKEWGHDRSDDIQAEDLINAFAHELAEQQRGHIQKQCVNDSDGDGDCAACARNPEALCRQPTLEGHAIARIAYLIDPYASAAPERPVSGEETSG